MSLFDDFDAEDAPEAPDHSELSAAPWKQEEHPQQTYRPYAGVGSRSTPTGVQKKMVDIACQLGDEGWTLRSGGAEGADAAFGWGAGLGGGYREIYLPVEGWRSKKGLHCHTFPRLALKAARRAWDPYADRTGVAPWENLKRRTKQFMARNVCQIAGPTLSRPSKFLICWTPDGVASGPETTPDTGGTGQAIRVASRMDVPIFNLNRDEHRSRVLSRLAGVEEKREEDNGDDKEKEEEDS